MSPEVIISILVLCGLMDFFLAVYLITAAVESKAWNGGYCRSCGFPFRPVEGQKRTYTCECPDQVHTFSYDFEYKHEHEDPA